jgi:hypothetical protein
MIHSDQVQPSNSLAWRAPALLAALALAHALLFAWLAPPWQMPDEPTLFEYAALVARLGRVPAAGDSDPALERQIADSLVRQRFFEYLTGQPPARTPRGLDDVREAFFLPRQVGADPPLYFLIASLPLRALAGQAIETQLLALRLLNVLMVVGATLCAYAAARELCDQRPTTNDQRPTTNDQRPTTNDQRPTTNDQRPTMMGWGGRGGGHGGGHGGAALQVLVAGNLDRGSQFSILNSQFSIPLAVGLLVALHPMFVFAGVGAGNDGLANLIGAALCWAALRAMRLGLSLPRVAALLALALLGLLTKRTLLPPALLLASIGGWLAIRHLARRPAGRFVRLGVGGALLALLALGVGGALAGERTAGAAEWIDTAALVDAPRVPAAPSTGRPALELRPGGGAAQALPGVGAEWAQNQELRFSARVWTAEGAGRGRLAIDFGWATTEVPFEADERGRIVAAQTFIPLFCPYVMVSIRSDEGTIYADRLDAESGRRPGFNLLSNGDALALATDPDAPRARLARYLRLRELVWIWRSGRLLEPPPLGWGLARIFFISFWGEFGYMSLPLVGAKSWDPWEGALWLVCAGGLLGTFGWLARAGRPTWRRRAVALLFALVLAGLLFPLLNAYTQTRDQVIQQGRYLFPALTPIAILLSLGWRALVPARWRGVGLAVWAAWWALFAAAALALIAGFY